MSLRAVAKHLPVFAAAVALESGVAGAGFAQDVVGHITTMEGKAFIGRLPAASPFGAQVSDDIRVEDAIETEPSSRLKILVGDTTLLIISENTRLVISDFHHQTPTLALLLERGTARILNLAMPPSALQLEMQTPHGVIRATDSAHFIVSVQEESAVDTIVNVGPSGAIHFHFKGQTVGLGPAQYMTVSSEAPRVRTLGSEPARLSALLEASRLKDAPRSETARDMLRALEPPERPIARSPADIAAFQPMAGKAVPLVPMTPPAVISGAASPLPQPAPPPPVIQPAAPPPPAPVPPPVSPPPIQPTAPPPPPVVPPPPPPVTAPPPPPPPPVVTPPPPPPPPSNNFFNNVNRALRRLF